MTFFVIFKLTAGNIVIFVCDELSPVLLSSVVTLALLMTNPELFALTTRVKRADSPAVRFSSQTPVRLLYVPFVTITSNNSKWL
ncbi:hypothetical protein MBCUR_05020 [Methanobrevibacter curvatus]|uniref:Uncharacterized protein n=1 Tax=Methanobrevibacter curvatus TaxID=49547 RepID=A0A166CD36_9EURY|nr:hypothetical protein MBCUR_05020 [Methanobrevibacter curvatus]